MCSNATRVYIDEKIFDFFIDKIIEKVKQITPGDPHESSTKTGAMINGAHAEKVLQFIELAKKEVRILNYLQGDSQLLKQYDRAQIKALE